MRPGLFCNFHESSFNKKNGTMVNSIRPIASSCSTGQAFGFKPPNSSETANFFPARSRLKRQRLMVFGAPGQRPIDGWLACDLGGRKGARNG